MQHIKIFKRPDGTQVQLTVRFVTLSSPDAVRWSFSVVYKPKGKQKWLKCFSSDDYHYRNLSYPARDGYAVAKYLEYVTEYEILHVQQQLYALMSPCLPLIPSFVI